MTYRPCLHFVGFDKAADRYARAVNLFGEPAFVHPAWDFRALADVAPDDTVIFARSSDYRRFIDGTPIVFGTVAPPAS